MSNIKLTNDYENLFLKLKEGDLKDIGKTANNLGYSSGEKFNPMSVDLAQEYMVALVKAKKEENPNIDFAVTQSVAFDPNETESKNAPNSINSVSTFLTSTYASILSSGFNGYIYTVISARSTQDLDVNHQNWLCVDTINKKLIRFEPSYDYEEFQFREFCNNLISKLQSFIQLQYELVVHSINEFNSCRAFSTMLAVMHLKGIDFKHLSNIQKDNRSDINVSMPFIFLLQNYLSNFKDKCPIKTAIPPARGRRMKSYSYLIVD